MLTREEIGRIFAETGAVITDSHFVYAQKADGWYHGRDYVNKDAIYPFTRFVSPLCECIAEHFLANGIEVVVGPTVGAVSLSQWTTHWLAALSFQKEVLAVCADEEDVIELYELDGKKLLELGLAFGFAASGEVNIKLSPTRQIESIDYMAKVATRRVIKRGYDKIVKDRRCLVVEDVVNTGATVKKTIGAIRLAGGIVDRAGCLCNRSGGKVTAASLGITELFSLYDVDMKMYKEKECPVCKERGPQSVRRDIGKGKEFFARTGL